MPISPPYMGSSRLIVRVGFPKQEETLQRLKIKDFKQFLCFSRENTNLVVSRLSNQSLTPPKALPFVLEEVPVPPRKKQAEPEEQEPRPFEALVAEQIAYLLRKFE